jgi:hypothetical protein
LQGNPLTNESAATFLATLKALKSLQILQVCHLHYFEFIKPQHKVLLDNKRRKSGKLDYLEGKIKDEVDLRLDLDDYTPICVSS